MLIPKLRFHSEIIDGEEQCCSKYYVWDTDECGFIENRTLSCYDTKEECQKAIDYYNSFNVIAV